MNSDIGDALIAAVEWAWPRMWSRAEEVFDRVVEAAKPHPPMTLRTLDGELVTGLAVMNRGQVLIFVGVREPSTTTSSSRAVPPPVHHSPRSLYQDDLPEWARDPQLDPYRRYP